MFIKSSLIALAATVPSAVLALPQGEITSAIASAVSSAAGDISSAASSAASAGQSGAASSAASGASSASASAAPTGGAGGNSTTTPRNLNVTAIAGVNGTAAFQCWQLLPEFVPINANGTAINSTGGGNSSAVGGTISLEGIEPPVNYTVYNEAAEVEAHITAPQFYILVSGSAEVSLGNSTNGTSFSAGDIFVAADVVAENPEGHTIRYAADSVVLNVPIAGDINALRTVVNPSAACPPRNGGAIPAPVPTGSGAPSSGSAAPTEGSSSSAAPTEGSSSEAAAPTSGAESAPSGSEGASTPAPTPSNGEAAPTPASSA